MKNSFPFPTVEKPIVTVFENELYLVRGAVDQEFFEGLPQRCYSAGHRPLSRAPHVIRMSFVAMHLCECLPAPFRNILFSLFNFALACLLANTISQNNFHH